MGEEPGPERKEVDVSERRRPEPGHRPQRLSRRVASGGGRWDASFRPATATTSFRPTRRSTPSQATRRLQHEEGFWPELGLKQLSPHPRRRGVRGPYPFEERGPRLRVTPPIRPVRLMAGRPTLTREMPVRSRHGPSRLLRVLPFFPIEDRAVVGWAAPPFPPPSVNLMLGVYQSSAVAGLYVAFSRAVGRGRFVPRHVLSD